MRKLIYSLIFVSVFSLPAMAMAQTVDHSAHHPQKEVLATSSASKMDGMMMQSENGMGCGCCNKMGMMQGDMMGKKMDGMQCMGTSDGKPGCCAKMMKQGHMSSPHSNTFGNFNQ